MISKNVLGITFFILTLALFMTTRSQGQSHKGVMKFWYSDEGSVYLNMHVRYNSRIDSGKILFDNNAYVPLLNEKDNQHFSNEGAAKQLLNLTLPMHSPFGISKRRLVVGRFEFFCNEICFKTDGVATMERAAFTSIFGQEYLGVAGNDFLKQNIVLFDFKDTVIRFLDKNELHEIISTEGLKEYPCKVESSKHPNSPLSIYLREDSLSHIQYLLDFGYNGGICMNESFLTSMASQPKDLNVKKAPFSSVTGITDTMEARVCNNYELKIGKEKHTLKLVVLDEKQFKSDPILGMDFIRLHSYLAIDAIEKKVYYRLQ